MTDGWAYPWHKLPWSLGFTHNSGLQTTALLKLLSMVWLNCVNHRRRCTSVLQYSFSKVEKLWTVSEGLQSELRQQLSTHCNCWCSCCLCTLRADLRLLLLTQWLLTSTLHKAHIEEPHSSVKEKTGSRSYRWLCCVHTLLLYLWSPDTGEEH